MNPVALLFTACFAVCVAGVCFLAYTGHWVFGGLVLVLAAVMVCTMVTGSGK